MTLLSVYSPFLTCLNNSYLLARSSYLILMFGLYLSVFSILGGILSTLLERWTSRLQEKPDSMVP